MEKPVPSPRAPLPFERQESDLLTIIKPDQRTEVNTYAENLEKKFSSSELGSDPFPELVTFPDDDIDVEECLYKIYETTSPLTSFQHEIQSAALGTYSDPHIKVYDKKYLVVRKKYSSNRGACAILPSNEPNESFPENHWPENPIGDPAVESKLYLSVAILRGYKDEDAKRDAQLRHESNREPIFSVFPFQRSKLEKPLDPRQIGGQFVHHREVTHLLAHCEKLQFNLGEIEPLFCQAALYDIGKKKKISESWSFDSNSSGMLSMLGSRVVNQVETSAKKALFTIPEPSPDIYLLVRVEKTLRGVEIDAAVEPYAKGQLKQKELQKLAKDVAQSMVRLGDYLQPFAWGALQLFNEGGQLVVGDLTQIRLVRSKADDSEQQILELLRKRQGKDKKITTLPCDFVFNFKIVDEKQRKEIDELIDPSYLPINKPLVEVPAVREIQDFTEFEQVTAPTLEYINNLYIYPESVNFSRAKDNNSRNISINVQFRDSDKEIDAIGMNVIYGKSSGAAHRPSARTPVIYHKKTPTYFEEIKIRLPPVLTPQHHILFTFSHVNCQSKGKNQDVENIIGYAAIPFFMDNKILEDSTYNVPIASTITPGYLAPEAEAALKWIDNRKPIFTFRTYICSTVFSQDGNLNEFFKQFSMGSNSKQLSMALRKIHVVENNSLAQYFPVMLNMIITVLCTRTDSCLREAFESLIVILERVQALPGQDENNLIQFYIDYIFENPAAASIHPFHVLVSQFSEIISIGQSSQNEEWIIRSANQAQFIFAMVNKSMILYLQKRKLLNKERVNSFSKEFLGDMKELVRSLTAVIISNNKLQTTLSRYVALFLTDMFSLMDRGFILPLAGSFVTRLDPRNVIQTLVTAKFKVLKIFCTYEHFIPLSLPIVTPLKSVITIMEDFWKQHYLVGLLLDEVSACLSSPEPSNRLKAITTLRDILWKQACSPLLDHPEKMKRAISMFFPFIFIGLERVENLRMADKKEKQEWSICTLFIICHCDKENLMFTWWAMDTIKHHLSFLQLLRECIDPLDDEHLIRESSFIILDTLESYMSIMEKELSGEDGPLMENFFETLIALLSKHQTVSFLSCFFLTIRRFITKFPHIIFSSNNTRYCEALCYQCLRFTNSVHAVPRSEAGSLLYMIIKMNFQLRGNFSRSKLQSTIAISRLCGEEKGEDFPHLQKTLDYVAKLAKKEFRDNPLGAEVEDLVHRLFKVIQDSSKIHKYNYDPEMIVDLTYQVSLGYKESPDLRLTWIENLVSFHATARNYEEVAQCKFLIAGLIIDSLKGKMTTQCGLPQCKEEIQFFCPNIDLEPSHPSGKGSADENLFTSVRFSERGLIEVLGTTPKFLKKSQRYETCVDMYNILLEYYQTKKDYRNLSICFEELKTVCHNLVNTDETEGRLFNNYYRVSFFGVAFGEVDGKEMIYKEDAMVRLAEFTERLKQQYSKIGTLAILPNGPVDVSKLDPKAIHVQVIAVLPYFEDEASRTTEWDRNYDICDFIYETPFTANGKAHGDLSVQCKRKTIVTTERKFPYVKKRLMVSSKKEIVLQPLQNAIEIIKSREKALRRELNMSTPNPKTLQIQLQGAVLAQVNAGPIEIAKTFLGSNAEKYNEYAEDIQTLCNCINEFMVVCKFALKLNNTLIKSDQIAFQSQCESSFADLQAEVSQILKSTPGTTFSSP